MENSCKIGIDKNDNDEYNSCIKKGKTMSMLYPSKEETSKSFEEGMRALEDKKRLERIRKEIEKGLNV